MHVMKQALSTNKTDVSETTVPTRHFRLILPDVFASSLPDAATLCRKMRLAIQVLNNQPTIQCNLEECMYWARGRKCQHCHRLSGRWWPPLPGRDRSDTALWHRPPIYLP